jgi:hypothetical protein
MADMNKKKKEMDEKEEEELLSGDRKRIATLLS